MSGFTGTGPLIRLALRRDRILLPAWIVGFAVIAGFSASATKELYPSQASRLAAASSVNATAALVAMYGRIYDPTSLGALSLFKMTAFGAAIVAILMVVVVVRHTRAEEETGRLELVGSAVVGRSAPLAAALLVGSGACLLLGLFTALALIGAGLPVAGSLAFGAAWAAVGMVFAAVAGVFAQLTSSARVATGLGVLGVGTAYVVRAVGDVQDATAVAMLSPFAWGQQVRAYAGDRFAMLAVPVLAIFVLMPLAFTLRARRDLGAGMLAERAGPAANPWPRGDLALAWRLQRGMLLSWLVGFAVLGLVFGSIAHQVGGLLNNPQVEQILKQIGGLKGLTDAFLAAEMAILATAASAYGLAALGRLRTEEASGHTEDLLATALSRVRWAGGHVAIGLAGVTALLLVVGLSAGAGHAVAVGDASQIPRIAIAALAHAPSAWVLVGIAVALFGWAPRAAPAAWGFLVAFIVLGEFGILLGFPGWLLDLSPFSHAPMLPGGHVDPVPLVALTVVTIALVGAGMYRWRKRDLVW